MKKNNLVWYFAAALFCLPLCVEAQHKSFSTQGFWQPAGKPFSPEVHEDGRITFRLRGRDVKQVQLLFGEWNVKPQPMRKDSAGVWSITIGPQPPGVYAYLFNVDGVNMADLSNPDVKAGTEVYGSMVEVCGGKPAFDQWQNVPHGTVHTVRYVSTALGKPRSMRIYLPPQYEAGPNRRFPVLCLRHGGGDNETSWTQTAGRADVIMDNLLAEDKTRPMIIVMPNGLTDGSWAGGSTKEGMEALEKELLQDILPYIRKHYRTLPGRENTAIAGLSMGGGQAYVMGLRHLETFAWIGQFSSGLLADESFDINERAPGVFDNPQAVNQQLRLLWTGCGTDDPRMEGHRRLSETLAKKGIRHETLYTPGGHEWTVWRVQLHAFLQRLFH
ncbi:alpha/beta hydrolase [Chitinophaga sp. GCM10012297]|uniref:Enterochelin esterase n=1 Tax=Chitinophaga chungangae TaxID=2821488 RepID=A0ABS3YAR1_9BACT|nr:esterase [Chitinophaga chungangae]MBO9151767.1 hypothetical protein [Chitinophaga chungangae]